MRSFKLFIILLIIVIQGFAQQPNAVKRPKLVVGVVVDQMRWDYLYRYHDRYVQGGFLRLLGQGYSCENTMVNYLPSFTAPGHACVYTGAVPAMHGIAGNDWIDKPIGKAVYCVEDSTVQCVGGANYKKGSMSPATLLTTTITDELRLATNGASRVYGIAIKDRGSILPAGHLANGAWWMDDASGDLCSSTYYKDPAPMWLTGFNRRKLQDSLMQTPWKLLYAAATYTQSTADDNKYELAFKGEAAPVFPHSAGTLKDNDKYHILKGMPAGNTYTLQAAMACIEGNKLGRGKATDFLCVSLSSPDYTGHQFSPNSMEAEDMYLRLDREMAAFLTYLDGKVGKGEYVLFLTADHGAAHNPIYLSDSGVRAGFLPFRFTEMLREHLLGVFKTDSLVRGIMNYQVFINERRIMAKGIALRDVKQTIMDWLDARPEIAYVVDMERAAMNNVPEPILKMAVNGYAKNRSGSIQFIPHPGWFSGYALTGTSHGTWNPYDTHIPLLWYGWHIPHGETHRQVDMTDISATLAALLHIQMPNGCIGKVITEITDRK